MRVLGVDGCPGGWVGALVADGRVAWHTGSFAELVAVGADLIAVDIPIGLPAGADRRQADVDARRLLGPARSSVFHAPPRVVLEADSQPEATRLSRDAGSKGVSIQMFHVLAKVREVDEAVRRSSSPIDEGLRRPPPPLGDVVCRPSPAIDEAIRQPSRPFDEVVTRASPPTSGSGRRGPSSLTIEVHPEVSFRRLAQLRLDPGAELPEVYPDAVALPSKHSAAGRDRRLGLLRSWLPDLSLPHPRPGRATVDDCLDALVAAWTGQRWLAGEADVLGDELDELGVPMRIVV